VASDGNPQWDAETGSRRTTTRQRRGLQPTDRPAVKQIIAGAERNKPKIGCAAPEGSLRFAVDCATDSKAGCPSTTTPRWRTSAFSRAEEMVSIIDE
jgi:hypothetical protein